MIRLLTALLMVALGCQSTERTRLRLDVPPSAVGQITSVEILLVNDGSDACGNLIRWATGSCGVQCDSVERDAALPSDPAQRVEILPDESGFGVPELDLDADGPLEVVVIAHVAGADAIYGCRGISRGERVDLPLWWPWCAARACDRFFHEACNARVICGADALTDPLEIRCSSSETTVPVWEECEAPINQDRCRPAMLSCSGERSTFVDEGVCPDTEGEEMCVTDSGMFVSAMDVDCNGAHPLCDVVDCRAGLPCGDAACMGLTRCRGGTFAECVFTDDEICNGADDDCDRMVDEAAALIACNARRAPEAPAANECAGIDGCRCGSAPACTEAGTACCDGTCVNLANDSMYCGTCEISCIGDQRCIAGRCAERDMPDGGVGMDAFVPECFERSDCNLTHDGAADACLDGLCMCGTGDDCAFPEICCQGACVNPFTSLRFCGGCDRPADAMCVICDRGRCIPPD